MPGLDFDLDSELESDTDDSEGTAAFKRRERHLAGAAILRRRATKRPPDRASMEVTTGVICRHQAINE